MLIVTADGSTLYFRVMRWFSIVASKAFMAEILSANRQLMGILGLEDPSNRMYLLSDRKSAGRSFISGLFKMPSSNNVRAS